MANFTTKPQVGFLDACKMAVQKCVTFNGRARRSEYWWAVLGMVIVNLLLSWIPIVSNLVSLFITLVSLSLTFRRLHDTNHSGWLVGISFVLSWIGIGVIVVGAMMGGLSFADFAEGNEYLVENLSKSLMGASLAYIAIGCICLIVSGIMEIVIFVFCCMDSDLQANKYGESPKYDIEEA